MTQQTDPDCIFCKIVAGDIPSAKVYEDEIIYVFMNLQQKNPGHSLIIPKTHVPNIYSLDEDLAATIARIGTRVAKAVKKGFSPDGVNILQNNEPAAMQAVFHFHTHVIPRYTGDDLFAIWRSPASNSEELSRNAERLRAALES